MTDSLRPIFKRAGNNCNYCYLSFESSEKSERIIFQKKTRNSLLEIINSYNDRSIDREIAKTAIRKCNECRKNGYENPEIFKYLGEQGIKLF